MALRAVIEHPKFHNLTQRLGVERWGGLGVLEAMWHFCGKFTPAGDIGKYSDAEIEAWIGWKGEPGVLIAVLVQCRWIDRHDVYRLVVHDWHLHADAATKLALKRAQREFIVPTVSEQCRDSVTTTSGLPEPEPVPETEKEVVVTESKGGAGGSEQPSGAMVRASRFTRPTKEELVLYFGELGMPNSEAGRYWDHYECNGWKVGKNPMKDWRAAARNWKRGFDERAANKRSPRSATFDDMVGRMMG